MSKAFWRLAVRSEFSSSHALRNYNGKCENLHGHNFSVEAVVEGKKLTQDTEFMMDFSVLKKILNRVLDTLDHKDLNTTPPFVTMNPTSENLAQYIFQQFALAIAAQTDVCVYSVTVGEKAAQSATYYEG